MTGDRFSWARHERLRRSLADDLEARWARWRQDSGHGDCDGWAFDVPEARLVCACGEVVEPAGEAS